MLPWFHVITTSCCRVTSHKSPLNISEHITETYQNRLACLRTECKPTKIKSRAKQTYKACSAINIWASDGPIPPIHVRLLYLQPPPIMVLWKKLSASSHSYTYMGEIDMYHYTCVWKHATQAAPAQACGLCVGRAGGSERGPVLRSMRGTWPPPHPHPHPYSYINIYPCPPLQHVKTAIRHDHLI